MSLKWHARAGMHAGGCGNGAGAGSVGPVMQRGDRVPDLSAPDQQGNTVRLADLWATGPVVLFFYPKAMTSGCTKESCHFRDLAGEFAEVGAHRVGVSADRVERQAEFDRKHDLGYPLLSDPDRTIAAAFGVKRMGPLFNKRSTFVIGADGTVLDVITSELDMDSHADRALEVLRSAG
jgi:peroxiredoxin Q/BCP